MRRTLFLLAIGLMMIPLASAQQSSALVLSALAPSEALAPGEPTSVEAVATYTADLTAITATNGIPVTYFLTQAPAWATVSITPANDVFPFPSGVPAGASYSMTRTFTITIVLSEDAPAGETALIEVGALTQPGPLGRSAEGRASFPILVQEVQDAVHDTIHCPEELPPGPMPASETTPPEPDHLLEARTPDGTDVTVQQAGTTPLSTPWIAIAAFGLVGAGVGLVLRRRFRKA